MNILYSEQNNLLANLGPNRTGYSRQIADMKNNMTSLPLVGSADKSTKPAKTPVIGSPLNGDTCEGRSWTPADLPPGVMHGYIGLKTESNRTPDLKPGRKSPPLSTKPKCPVSRPPMLPPCRVCGDSASGFHYGVNTCEACKGFFRRSIIKSTPHACVNSGNCKLIRGRRTSCSACRFKRCLEVGMSKHAIKTGRYTHELRSKNILEVKRLQKQTTQGDDVNRELDGTKYGVSEQTAMECDKTSDPDQRTGLVEVKSGEYASVLDQLLEGQQCLYEFLDEYFDEDLMVQRQNAVYDRYLRDKKRREMWENARARDKQGVNRVFDQQSENISSQRHFNDCANNIGKGLSGDSYSSHQWNTQNSDNSSNNDSKDISYSIYSNSMDTPRGINSNSTDTPRSVYSADNLPSVYSKSADNLPSVYRNNTDNLPSIYSNNTDNLPSIYSNSTDNSPYSVSPNDDDASYLASLRDPTEELKVRVLSIFMEDMKKGVTGMLAFSKAVPGFSDLPDEDQVTLVQASKIDIWSFGHIRCFNSELQVGACEWKFHADELSKVWGEELIAMTFNMMRIGRDLDLNKEETAVLRALAVSFTDRCYPLQDRAAVDEIHDHMLHVLKETVMKRHRNFNTWFARAIRFISNLREVGTLYEEISSNLNLEWSVLKDDPTLLEVFMS